jgi:hypothetical protein
VDDEVTWLCDGPSSDPVHVRTIEIRVFEDEDAFELNGRLRDVRPWADGATKPRQIHDMELRIKVDRATLTITAVSTTMHAFPHAECPTIEPAFDGLVGLSIARGYTKAVQERFGRQAGCSHLEFLARALGPAVIQAMPSSASRLPDAAAVGRVVNGGGWLTNTCHFWAEGGIGMAKLEEGWRPGSGEYPAPSLVEIRAKKAGSEDDGR